MKHKPQGILLAIALATFGYFIGLSFFNANHALLIAIITLLVTLWSNQALPLGVVSLLPIILFPITDLLTTNQVANNYSNSIIFLFLGGFLLAISVQKTGLHKVFAHKILSIFPSTPTGIIYSLAITSALMSAFLSNTTTALLLISVALFLTNNKQLKIRLVLAVAYGASVGGIITPIGSPPNLLLLGFLETQNLPSINFLHWTYMTFPLAIIMLIFIGFVLSRGINQVVIEEINIPNAMSKPQKQLSWILISMIVLLFINSPIKPFYDGLGLNEKGILLGYGLLMFLPGLNYLKWKDTKEIPYDIIFLFGAGFSIALAFIETGFAQEIASLLTTVTHLDTFFIILIIAAFVTFSTEITSNTALVSMILPIIYTMSLNSGLPHDLFLMVATICASYAFMLPIATPPNAIAMSSGIVKVKDMAIRGLLFNIFGIFLISIYAIFFW